MSDEQWIYEGDLALDKAVADDVRFEIHGYQVRTYHATSVGRDGTVRHVHETIDGKREEWTEHISESAIGQMMGGLLGSVMDDEAKSWFYLSFADGDRPTGEQWLGGAYVFALSPADAVSRSHKLKINPGGEVQIGGPLPIEAFDENVPISDRERLLTADELGPNSRWN